MAELKVPAIEKLLDYTASGIGAVAGPMLLPWKAYWEGKARLASARVDAEVHRLQAESEAETSPIIAKARAEARESLLAPDAEVRGTAEITREDIIQRVKFQERKRHTNIRAVVTDAADELGDKEVSDHDPDPDWTARFFDIVQDVSSEDLQKIYAKILAGEVESPGRTSLRTLEVLRNMTKRDAEQFQVICNFVLYGEFVFYDARSVAEFNALGYNNILHLQDCGLINMGPVITMAAQSDGNEPIVLHYQRGLLLATRTEGASKGLEIPGYLLTSAGKELYRIAQCTLHEGYLRLLSEFLRSKGYQLHYSEWNEKSPDGRPGYGNSISIEPYSRQVEESSE